MSKVSTSHDHNRPLNRQDYKTLSLAALGGDARLTAAGVKVVSLVELAGE